MLNNETNLTSGWFHTYTVRFGSVRMKTLHTYHSVSIRFGFATESSNTQSPTSHFTHNAHYGEKTNCRHVIFLKKNQKTKEK